MKRVFAIIADILAIVGFFLACFIACRVFPNTENTSFDYQAILVGIVGGIFTLLVGWNIFQMVDWKTKEKKVNDLQLQLEKDMNYIHNKADYNQALIFAMMSQTISSTFAPNDKSVLKYQMLIKGIQSLKVLSKFPDCEIEIQALMKTLIKGLKNSISINLSDEIKTELLVSCGEIENRNKIFHFHEFIDLIKQA